MTDYVNKLCALAKALLARMPEDEVLEILIPIYGGEALLAVAAAKLPESPSC